MDRWFARILLDAATEHYVELSEREFALLAPFRAQLAAGDPDPFRGTPNARQLKSLLAKITYARVTSRAGASIIRSAAFGGRVLQIYLGRLPI
jgi:hypothetical protein